MAFDYLGTLSLEQLRDLRSFLDEELETIDQEINTLRVELDNSKRMMEELTTADGNFGGNTIGSLSQKTLADVIRIPEQDDTNAAVIMEKIKKPFITHIKFKRERLEYKIKKLTDSIEQIEEMVDRKATAQTQTRQLLNQLEAMFNEDNSNYLFQTTDELRNFRMGIIPES